MIQWKIEYATGVKEIDEQHQWLFEFSNTLEHELKADGTQIKVDHILKTFEKYAQKHFQYEEKCMLKWKCPFASENVCAHRKFIFAYDNFLERYYREGHSTQLAWKIQNMIEKWIVDHICRIDIKLVDFRGGHAEK